MIHRMGALGAGAALACVTLVATVAVTPASGMTTQRALGHRTHLAASSVTTDRIAGADRYETAAKLANQFGPTGTVVVANGSTAKQGFDALSANYLAGLVDAPVLLTRADSLPGATAAAVRQLFASYQGSGYQILVMGKEDSVSAAVADQLNDLAETAAGHSGHYVVRVAGDSRYATGVEAATFNGDDRDGACVGSYSIGDGSAVAKTAFLASGQSNADALAAGPISNALHIPVYLASNKVLTDDVGEALDDQDIKNVIVLGGADRIPDSVIRQMRSKGEGVAHYQRIAGDNRYDTAAKLYDFARNTLADSSGNHYGSIDMTAQPCLPSSSAGGTGAFLANGTSGFPDALAVGPLAAAHQSVLLTTPSERLSPAARAFLQHASPSLTAVTALGTPSTVSDGALTAAAAAVY